MTDHDTHSPGLNPEVITFLERHLDAHLDELTAVRDYLTLSSLHSGSQYLPPNPYPIEEHFAEYPAQTDLFKRYAEREPNPEANPTSKTDFLYEDDPNVGWKFHLNIEPSDVENVLSYLSDHKFYSKYLGSPQGGHQPNPGKIFTVYVGSFEKVLETAPILSNDLEPYLRRPDATDDIEFAPGIVGRFLTLDGRFTYYGPKGIQQLSGDSEKLKADGITPPYHPEYQRLLELQAIRILTNPDFGYGNYFIDTALIENSSR